MAQDFPETITTRSSTCCSVVIAVTATARTDQTSFNENVLFAEVVDLACKGGKRPFTAIWMSVACAKKIKNCRVAKKNC